MRRFSQRNSLVTLSDINITPLLDLAFVLLIIFIIISPSIKSTAEQALQLPQGGQPTNEPIDPKNIRAIEANLDGTYLMGGVRLNLEQLKTALLKAARENPKMIVDLRADKKQAYEFVFDVMDFCDGQNIPMRLPSLAPPK